MSDGGERWQVVGPVHGLGEVRGILPDLHDPARLLLGVDRVGLFSTVDSGTTWTPEECPSPDILDLVRDAGESGAIWVPSGGQVMRRAASGAWSALSVEVHDVRGAAVQLSFSMNHVASGRDALGQAWSFVLTRQGLIYRTPDSGATWELVHGDLVNPAGGYDLVLVERDGAPPMLYFPSEASYHRGAIGPFPTGFARLTPGNLPNHVHSVAVGRHVYLGTEWGIFVVDEETGVATQQSCNVLPFAMLVDPRDERRVFAGGERGEPVASSDGGATWRMLDKGWSTAFTLNCMALSPHDPRVLYAGINDGQLRRITLSA